MYNYNFDVVNQDIDQSRNIARLHCQIKDCDEILAVCEHALLFAHNHKYTDTLVLVHIKNEKMSSLYVLLLRVSYYFYKILELACLN